MENNEDLINDLIGVIWPALDAGRPKDEIKDIIDNVLDSWTPPGAS
jgi:hypothetical protein